MPYNAGQIVESLGWVRCLRPPSLSLASFHSGVCSNGFKKCLACAGCDHLRVFHPVTVRDGQTTPVRAFAGKSTPHDGLHRVPVELRGKRPDGRDVVHSRAEVLLAAALPRGERRLPDLRLPPYPLDPDDVYQQVLFHGLRAGPNGGAGAAHPEGFAALHPSGGRGRDLFPLACGIEAIDGFAGMGWRRGKEVLVGGRADGCHY